MHKRVVDVLGQLMSSAYEGSAEMRGCTSGKGWWLYKMAVEGLLELMNKKVISFRGQCVGMRGCTANG